MTALHKSYNIYYIILHQYRGSMSVSNKINHYYLWFNLDPQFLRLKIKLHGICLVFIFHQFWLFIWWSHTFNCLLIFKQIFIKKLWLSDLSTSLLQSPLLYSLFLLYPLQNLIHLKLTLSIKLLITHSNLCKFGLLH